MEPSDVNYDFESVLDKCSYIYPISMKSVVDLAVQELRKTISESMELSDEQQEPIEGMINYFRQSLIRKLWSELR